MEGFSTPFPATSPLKYRAGTTIAVKLAKGPSLEPVHAEAMESEGRVPSALQVVLRSVELMQSRIVAHGAAAATILIEPEFTEAGGFWLRSFSEAQRYIELGEKAADAALPRIAAALPWLRAG